MRNSQIFLVFITLFFSACSTTDNARLNQDHFADPGFPKLKSDFNLISTDDRGKRLLGPKLAGDFALITYLQFKKFPLSPEEIIWLRQLDGVTREPEFSNVHFEFVVLNEKQNREELQKIEKELHLNKPFLTDPAQISAYDSGAKFAFDSVLFYRKSKTLVGNLNISSGVQEFRSKLRDLLSRKPAAVTQPLTPPIQYGKTLSAGHVIDYQKEIAPIIIKNCVKCHNEFGVAPWSMNSHADLSHWKKTIREVVLLRRMPPAQSDSYYRKYSNETKLSEEEIQKLIVWIDQGAPKKSSKDPLAKLRFEKPKEFRLGKPDLIIDLEDQKIAANETESVKILKSEWPLDYPVRIKGMDVQTNNVKATHHISNYYIIPGATHDQDRVAMFDGSYIPGYEPEFLPFSASYLVPPKAPLRLSPHVVPTGKDEVVKMRIGFYFDKSAQPNELLHCGIDTHEINIPPNDGNHHMVAQGYVTEDIRVVQVGTHMHKRGRSIKYTAITPENKAEVLLSLPNYVHTWQREYQLQEPLFIPKGSVVKCEGFYDNSQNNPRVQDPTKTIRYGWMSDDEMMACSCYALREADYQRIISKKNSNYSPLPADYNRDVISRTPQTP